MSSIAAKMQLTRNKCNLPLYPLSALQSPVILSVITEQKGSIPMLGIVTLLVALCVQIGFVIYQVKTRSFQTKRKHILRIGTFIVLTLLIITEVYWWGFRWISLFILLALMAAFGAIYLLKPHRHEKEYKPSAVVLSCLGSSMLLAFCILPGILFPQFEAIASTGTFEVGTVSETYIDTSRMETFSDMEEKRKLSVQFWYPIVEHDTEVFPLVLFSHGSFGFRGSNLSTFENLARNGYVVCSIDHSYQAFFAQHTDGSNTIVNVSFLRDATNIQNGVYDAKMTYDLTHEWMDLRTADMNFVIDEILQNAEEGDGKQVYKLINTEKTGVFGHSLGGAAAAQLGRDRGGIDAAIVVDGTMIGEQIGFKNGQTILNEDPYPIPLLNLYNDTHYEEAMGLGMAYDNIHASANATEAYEVVIRDSGHLNFTDLPLFSPVLARMLGTGEVDRRYCIEKMNQIVLEYFDYVLKESDEPQFQKEY